MRSQQNDSELEFDLWKHIEEFHSAILEAREIAKHVDSLLGECGLRLETLLMLRYLTKGSMSQVRLSDALSADKVAVSRWTKYLCTIGYVTKKHCDSDRRTSRISITPLGAEVLATATEKVAPSIDG